MRFIPPLTRTNIGLILNLVGTILITVALGKYPKGFGGTTDGYEFVYLVHPWGIWVGIPFIFVGFFLQLKWRSK